MRYEVYTTSGGYLKLYDRDNSNSVITRYYSGRASSDEFELFLGLCEVMLTRLSRKGAMGDRPLQEAAQREEETFSKLCPTPAAAKRWAQSTQTILARLRHGRSVNIDPAAMILDMFFKIEECALRL